MTRPSDRPRADVEVEVLRCPSCAAPVPLGDGDTARCSYCGASVEVPEAHRALGAAERRYNEQRGAARELLRRLGKPPSAIVRFLARAHGGTVVWLVVLGTPAAMALCAATFTLAGWLSLALFHVHLEDVVLYRYDPGALFFIGQLTFLLASLGSLVVLGAYTHRRGAGLRELQAGLSAKPPARAGGPATCRECGAPLSASAGEVAVTCPYCRADNLLAIPERWIGAARAHARKLAGAVEEAARAFEEEGRLIRRSLARRLAVVAALSSIAAFFFLGVTDFASLDSSTETVYQRAGRGLARFDWGEAVAAPALVLDEGDASGCAGLGCAPLLSERPCDERRWPRPLVIPAGACDAEGCTMHWYVALRRGDVLEITASGLSSDALIALESHVRGAPFHRDPMAWGAELPGQRAALVDGRPARLSPAPHDGWFELVLGAGDAAPGTSLAFCARLERSLGPRRQ